MSEISKVKLSGGPEKTATWTWLQDGQLKVEFMISAKPRRMFGNDIAYTITVREMEKLLSLIRQAESSVLQWLAEN
jgi:hypothetical protein